MDIGWLVIVYTVFLIVSAFVSASEDAYGAVAIELLDFRAGAFRVPSSKIYGPFGFLVSSPRSPSIMVSLLFQTSIQH